MANPKGGRALVVDDETTVRMMLIDVLETFGYVVDAADCGEAALPQLARGRYQTVVTDLRMPGMSGLDVAAAVRRVDPDVPVILLTGTGGTEAGSDEFRDYVRVVYKPVNVVKLMATIEAARDRAHGA